MTGPAASSFRSSVARPRSYNSAIVGRAAAQRRRLHAMQIYLAELPRSAASQIDPGAETRAGINRIRTAGLRRDLRSGAGRRAAACAKCVDIALCPCYDGLSRRAPARRCRAGGLHMSEPRLSVRDRCACTGEAAHAACAWFSPFTLSRSLCRGSARVGCRERGVPRHQSPCRHRGGRRRTQVAGWRTKLRVGTLALLCGGTL